jgi:hypothetical protein
MIERLSDFNPEIEKPCVDILNIGIYSIAVQEVEPDDPDYETAMGIRPSPNTPEEGIKKILIEEIGQKFWWLQEKEDGTLRHRGFAKKGKASEQIHISSGSDKIELYNFDKNFDKEHQQTIQSVLERMNKITNGKIVEKIPYIVFDDVGIKNYQNLAEYPDREGRAQPLKPDGSICVNPLGAKIGEPYRAEEQGGMIEGVNNNFEATLIHEISEMILYKSDGELEYKWKEEFGYNDGSAHKEWLVNSYARNGAGDDFAESMVAALINPSVFHLHPKKLEFIQREVLDRSDESLGIAQINMEIVHGEHIKMPELEQQPFKYKVITGPTASRTVIPSR